MLTVDTPVPGPRLRDVRNGLTIPPSLSLKTFAEGALHPAWWFDLFTTEPLEFASLKRSEGTVAELVARLFDPAATIADLAWLRSIWEGPPSSRASSTRLMPGRSSTPERMPSSCRTTGDDSSTGPLPRWRRCRRCSMRWATGPRCTSTEASCRAATSSRRWRGGEAALVGRAYLYGLMAGGERGGAGGRHPGPGGRVDARAPRGDAGV